MCKEKILQLLEDGKINADEAVKLFLDFEGCYYKKSCGLEEKIKKLSKCTGDTAQDLGYKIGCAYKAAKPKIKATAQCIAEKTSDVVRNLSKKLSSDGDTSE